MGDERCEIGPNVVVKESLENNNNNTSANFAHHFSTTANSNEGQDEFFTSDHLFSINSNNNNNHNEQDHFLPILTTTCNSIQHFSSNVAINNKEQDRFLPVSANSGNTNRSNSNNSSSNNKEQDRFLPIANVGRIMKKFIPGNGKISKDAKETVQECVSEFISFVTGEASDKCQREKRKTINGDDIIWAITTLGFEDYVTPLKQYLNRYRELEGEKLNVPKQQRLQQPHDQNPNMSYHTLYSSTTLLSHSHSQPLFVPND